MRIVYLLESTGLWGGVLAVFEAANHLHARGHEVTIVARRSEAPTWFDLQCRFVSVPDFAPGSVPDADVVVGTFWTTIADAVACGAGAPVHYCQGYEGDNPENAAVQPQIETVYRRDDTALITISPHLANVLQTRFGREARQIRYAIDHAVMQPGPARPAGNRVRVGLVGPYEVEWKDIATGLQACQLAHEAGLDLEVVRVTNTAPHPHEEITGLPIEWHVQVEPHQMGELYRSLDLFVGSSRGDEEGFFLPAVEAMACGLPCVLTDIPCHHGYGDEQYALFVPPSNPAEMAEAIVIAARHEPARAALRACALRTARRHNFDDHVTDLEAAFAHAAGIRTPTAAASAVLTPITPNRADPVSHPPTDTLAQLTQAAAETLLGLGEAYAAMDRAEDAARHREAAALIAPTHAPARP